MGQQNNRKFDKEGMKQVGMNKKRVSKEGKVGKIVVRPVKLFISKMLMCSLRLTNGGIRN